MKMGLKQIKPQLIETEHDAEFNDGVERRAYTFQNGRKERFSVTVFINEDKTKFSVRVTDTVIEFNDLVHCLNTVQANELNCFQQVTD